MHPFQRVKERSCSRPGSPTERVRRRQATAAGNESLGAGRAGNGLSYFHVHVLGLTNMYQIKAPHITTFRFPTTVNTWITLLIAGSLLYIGFSPSHPESPLYLPGRIARSYIGSYFKPVFWSFTGVHVLESLYTLHLCRKHHTGLVVGVRGPLRILQHTFS